jgi:hypothetical protein
MCSSTCRDAAWCGHGHVRTCRPPRMQSNGGAAGGPCGLRPSLLQPGDYGSHEDGAECGACAFDHMDGRCPSVAPEGLPVNGEVIGLHVCSLQYSRPLAGRNRLARAFRPSGSFSGERSPAWPSLFPQVVSGSKARPDAVRLGRGEREREHDEGGGGRYTGGCRPRAPPPCYALGTTHLMGSRSSGA